MDTAPFADCSGPGDSHTTAALGDGAHTFEVRATDPAGNIDPTPASRSFTVDADPPETTINSGPEGSTTDNTPTFTFSPDEGGSTFECRVDAAPFADCTSPHTIGALGEGAHTFEVRATDPAGNIDATPASRSFTVAPALQFAAASYSFSEDAGAVTLTVTRTGPTGSAVSVDYAVTGGTATPGTDFTLADGPLNFAAGETSKTISLTITDDIEGEPDETIEVTLEEPPGDPTLGSPDSTIVTIAGSDQQPDALISKRSSSGYVGNGIYNTTGSGQTIQWKQVRGRSRTFYVRVQNDGQATNDFQLKGSQNPSGAIVKYFRGTQDITATMRSADGYQVTVNAGERVTIRIQIKIKSSSAIGSLKKASLTATWTGDAILQDVVKAVVKVVRTL